MNYQEFLQSKKVTVPRRGFDVSLDELNPMLFDWQRAAVRWALQRGCAALFEECGLGKTFQQIEWAHHVCRHTGGDVLILAPLAVNAQTVSEGAKLGITVHPCRSQADVKPGINIANYEMLEHFDPHHFDGVVLDESSVLKNYTGKTKTRLLESFRNTPFRLCCTATPAPNDFMEIGNHAEFLGIMPSNEMLSRWFINDTMHFGNYRLKGHATADFWDWVSSWAVSLRKPSDVGFSDVGFELPSLRMHQHSVQVDETVDSGDQLFRVPNLTATSLHAEMRLTNAARCEKAADLVNGDDDYWVVWCNTNYEADELIKLIPGAIEIRGAESVSEKERKLELFSSGAVRVIITKPSIAGFGLNWQHCRQSVFVGLSYSFEQLYQAMRRIYRFGQQRPVDIHIITAQTEGAVLKVVQEKMESHEKLMEGLRSSRNQLSEAADRKLTLDAPMHIERGVGYELYHGDCCEVARTLPDDSIDFTVTSVPFSNLYIYSDSVRDMGNCTNDAEFFGQLEFLISELYRITTPGRLCAIHCKDLVNYKGRDGRAGLRDFSGDIIRAFERHDWQYHSKVTIWKDPVIEMQRTKAHGLLYKQLRKDSSISRQGMPDYLVVFRKWPQEGSSGPNPVEHTKEEFPLDMWQRYASPVWMDINQTRVLNATIARDNQDEKHICPLQLDVIERAIQLWTNPGDVVLDPFNGIGSTGYVALQMGRKYLGIELKESYFKQAKMFLEMANLKSSQANLFDADESLSELQDLAVA